MPNPYASTFLTHPKYDGKYIWRTWFIEECEDNFLFGMNVGNFRKVVEHGYRIGTELYLEDAPYYWSTSSKHRICGPYSVKPSTLPHDNCKVKQQDKAGSIVVYYDPEASKGPWLEKRKVVRRIEGTEIVFTKIATLFHFFPYRFRIEKTDDWSSEIVSHNQNCGWCPF